MMDTSASEAAKRSRTPPLRPAITVVALIFLAYSLIRFPVPSVNEPHYLCKARSFSEPEWCENDFFLQSSNAHAVFFALTGTFTQWFSFESVAVAGRVMSLTLLACGWMSVSQRLNQNRWAGIISAVFFCGLAMTGNFSGEWVVGGFESKVPAYGFSLLGVALWLDAKRKPEGKRYLLAGVFCGMAMALHPVVGAWFCVGIALSEIMFWTISRATARGADDRTFAALLIHGCTFFASSVLLALLGLIPALNSVLVADVSKSQADQANQIQVFWRLAHHLDPGTFPMFAWLHTACLLSLTVAGTFVLYRIRFRSQCSDESISTDESGLVDLSGHRSNWTSLLMLLLMSLLIAAIGTAIGWHDGPATELSALSIRAALLKFYPFRFFDALLPMVVSWISVSLILKWLPQKRLLQTGLTLIMSAVMLSFASFNSSAVPSGYRADAFASWKVACDWLKENTQRDSLIYGPREGFGLKWYAERAEYVCFKDCPQDAAGILEWNRRLWVMHKWAETSWKDGRCDDSDLRLLNRQTGITHILTRRLGPFQATTVYESGSWKVYEIPTTAVR